MKAFLNALLKNATICLLASCVFIPGIGCSKPASTAPSRPIVVTTTTMLTDLVQAIAGEEIQVEGLMGPGTDPHLYKPTARDAASLSQAQAILYNGLKLEGKMQDLFTQMAKQGQLVVAVAESIPPDQRLHPSEFEGHPDPHVWLDPQLWALCIEPVLHTLTQIAPQHEALFTSRAKSLHSEYQKLHTWGLKRIDELPENSRVLITSHDAFNYFGKAYAFDVIAVQGISTVTEAGLADITRVIDTIKEKQVRSIFVETSVSAAAIERISKDSGAEIGGQLFSDAMGIPGTLETDTQGTTYDLGTYEGMFRHNVNTIVDALLP